MDRTLADVIRERTDMSEDEKLRFARYMIKGMLSQLSINELDQVARRIGEIESRRPRA